MAAPKDREKALEVALAQIDKNFGKGAIMRMGSQERAPVEVIPTGSVALDVALGIGGLPRGRIVEIYGPESSGKTTLTALPTRLYDVTGGRVLLDGVDVRDLTLEELRTHVAMAFEDATLFSASVRDNVLMGAPDASEAALERALAIAQAGFARDLPKGLDTEIGADPDHRVLEATHVRDHVDGTGQVDDRIPDELPRAVPRDLAAPVDLDDGRAVERPLVRLRPFARRVRRRVLEQEDRVGQLTGDDRRVCSGVDAGDDSRAGPELSDGLPVTGWLEVRSGSVGCWGVVIRCSVRARGRRGGCGSGRRRHRGRGGRRRVRRVRRGRGGRRRWWGRSA